MRKKAVDLYFEELGHRPALMLVHGFPFDHTTWNAVAANLKDSYRLILPDLRGFGSSPLGESVSAMRLMAEDLAALLDRLGVEKVVLAGHSMGGYVGLAFAQAYPDRVAGLGLVCTQAVDDRPEKRQARLQMADLIKRKGIRALVEAGQTGYSSRPDVQETVRQYMTKSNPKSVMAALRGMAERPDMTDLLGQLPMPVAVVAGEQDALMAAEKQNEMVQLLQRGWLVQIPDAGHMALIEEPVRVADALRQLMQEAA